MQVKDEFAQDHSLDHPLPVFLTGDRQRFDDEYGSSLIIKMSLLVVATIAIGVAMTLALGIPLPKNPFADSTPTDPPAARMISDQSTTPTPAAPADQTTVQATTPPTTDAGQTASIAPTGNTQAAGDAAPAPDTTTDNQTAAPATGELLKQFQNWAATQDSQPPAAPAPSAAAQVEAIRPIQQNESVRPMQDTSPPQAEAAQGAPTTRILQDDPLPAPARAAHKHHKPPLTQNARAEIGAPKAARLANRPDRAARPDARPPQLQDQPPQPTQPPSLLQSLGLSRQ